MFRFLALKLSGRSPVIAAFYYFLPSYLMMHLLGMWTGHFWGRDGLSPMYATFESNVNMGVLVPVGVGLLCHFYFCVETQFTKLIDDGTVPREHVPALQAILLRYEKNLNTWLPVAVCLVLALALDGWTFFAKRGSWHCIDGGLVGIYAAVFKGINFFYIFFIAWKCLLTLGVLRRVDDFGMRIQPLHPDGVGGLAPAGKMALAVNWFLALLIVYFTFVYFFDPFFSGNMGYIVVTLACYPLTLTAIYISLEGVHRVMSQARDELLSRLSRETEEWLAGRGPAPEAALRLYPLVQAMPSWPFRPGTFARFFTTITLPFAFFIIQLIVNRDSILWDPAIMKNLETTIEIITGK